MFTLALIFVELITGRPALKGQDTIQLFVASANPLVRPTPRNRGVHVSPGIDRVLELGLAVKPRDRFLSAGAFASALRAAALETAQEPEADPASATVLASPAAIALHPEASAADRTQPAPAAPMVPVPVPHASTTSPQLATLPTPKSTATRPWIALALGALIVLPLALSALGGVTYLAFRKESPADAPAVMTSSAPSSASVRVAVSAPEPSRIRVDPGTFEMGSDKGAASERPVHLVTVSRPFFIDRTEVTVDDYLRCVRAGACSSPGRHGPGTSPEALAKLGPLCNAFDPTRGRHPINCVDRLQAEKFCQFVDKRLPTEAEWEYAARGESKADYPWGNAHPDCERLAIERMEGRLCRASKSTTEAVGSFPSNASLLGVLDLAGNVREWVADGYDERAYGRGDTTDPEVRLTIVRKAIARGGAWNSSLGEAASWHRSPLDRSLGDLSTGFRCARSIK